jgi:hypothetical protein
MTFQQQMAVGQSEHLHGNLETAAMYHTEALAVADTDVQRGQAMRDWGADNERLGLFDNATTLFDMAYQLHDSALADDAPGARRERGASGMYVGILALRSAVELELAHKPNDDEVERALEFERRGIQDLEAVEAAQGGVYDQYGINMWARAAVIEALHGKRTQAIKLGARALRRGIFSESAMSAQVKSLEAMPRKDRWFARGVALARGGASLAVTALSFRPTRRLALKLSQKAF